MRAGKRVADAIANDAKWNDLAVLGERCVCRDLCDGLHDVRPLFREIVIVLAKRGERALQRGDPFGDAARKTKFRGFFDEGVRE